MEQAKLHNVIAELAKFRSGAVSKMEYLEQLQKAVLKSLHILAPCPDLEAQIKQSEKVSMKFVSCGLYVLQQLSQMTKDDSLGTLISIQQQQKIKILLQMIFSIGILPSLFTGVDIALANKTVQLNLLDLEELSLVESYNMMREIVRSLLEMLKAPNLRSLILIHLGDLMAALLQLIHIGEIKKPIKGNNENQKTGNFVMTEEWYEKLVQDRIEFKAAYTKLVDDIYKPLVIRELLILLAPVHSVEQGKDITPPMWLRRAVSQQLSSYLTSPGGVSLIMRAMCDSSSDNVDWKKVDAIAKLISTVHGNLQPDEFYSLISPQVISLLNTTGAYCIPVAKKCIKNIYQYNSEICNKYIFDKLFEPFIICSKSVNENFNGTLISEDALSRCIDHINKCFTPGSKESALSFKALIKIIKIKFKLYMKVAGSAYQHQSAIQDLLIRFLHSETDLGKLTAIYNCLIFNEPHPEMLEMNEELEFEFGPSGGIQVVKKCKKNLTDENDSQNEVPGDYVLGLLSQNEEYSKKLLYDLFVVLLSSMMTACCDDPIEIPDSKQDLLDADELIVFLVGKSQKKLITNELLAILSENVEVVESIQENPQVLLKYIEKYMEKKAEMFLNDKVVEEDESEEKDNLVDLVVIMGFLDVMTMNVRIGSERWNLCKPLLNSIKIIKDNCKDALVKFLASSLYERIMTQGAVSGSKKFPLKSLKHEKLLQNVTELMSKNEEIKVSKKKNKRLLIEEVTKEVNGKSEFQKAVADVCSDDVATRGHGLIQLGKLIKGKDKEAIGQKEYVFTIFQQNLRHDDTYVYLSAINGLEAVAGFNAEMVIELLTHEYVKNKKDCAELQMKIGEVLVRVTRVLGEVVPKYKSVLINTFLIGAKSNDEYLRASSLSNLGEVLKILGYGVGGILQEIFVCVQSIATTDKSEVARRAAVLLAQLLLKGVTEDNFMILESIIRDLYRALIHIYKTDKDEVTKLHADLALAEIDRLVRSSFNRNVKLEKHIRVLDFPH